MKVLSLCGGIETGYLALKQLGIPVEEYHTFEISPPAIKVAQYHFPEIVHHGNVIGADFSQFKGFDMVIGGPCCQSLSITRADNSQLSNGLLGKSGIFYEVVRAIEEIQPKYFLVENVVPKSREDQDKMSALLGCEPIQINSSAFVPQDRVRLYWTNITRNPPPSECNLCIMDIMEHNVPTWSRYHYKQSYDWHGLDKRVCATLHVNTMDMLKRVYSPFFKAPTLTCVSGGYQEKKVWDRGPRKMTCLEYERLQGLPDGFTDVGGLTDTQRRSLCGNGWTLPVIKWIFKEILQWNS